MRICNGTFDAETPELVDIFARWPFPLSDFQKFAIDAIRKQYATLLLLPTQEMVKHCLLISQYRILLGWERR